MNLSLYSVNAFIVLDTGRNRVSSKYYRPKNHPLDQSKGFLTIKRSRRQGSKELPLVISVSVFIGFNQFPGDIILYDSHLVVYKHSLDVILYFVAGQKENELMLSTALNALADALTIVLSNPF